MKENVFLTQCPKCNQQQQIVSRGRIPRGSRKCFFCNKSFKLNHKTIIRKVK